MTKEPIWYIDWNNLQGASYNCFSDNGLLPKSTTWRPRIIIHNRKGQKQSAARPKGSRGRVDDRFHNNALRKLNKWPRHNTIGKIRSPRLLTNGPKDTIYKLNKKILEISSEQSDERSPFYQASQSISSSNSRSRRTQKRVPEFTIGQRSNGEEGNHGRNSKVSSYAVIRATTSEGQRHDCFNGPDGGHDRLDKGCGQRFHAGAPTSATLNKIQPTIRQPLRCSPKPWILGT